MHLSLQKGVTALMKAWKVDCVKVLLDRGAQVNIQDNVSGVIAPCVKCHQLIYDAHAHTCPKYCSLIYFTTISTYHYCTGWMYRTDEGFSGRAYGVCESAIG